MKKRKKTPRPKAIESEFDETVARLLQTDPKELEAALARVRRKQAEVEKYVKGLEEDIAEGSDRPAKKFRP